MTIIHGIAKCERRIWWTGWRRWFGWKKWTCSKWRHKDSVGEMQERRNQRLTTFGPMRVQCPMRVQQDMTRGQRLSTFGPLSYLVDLSLLYSHSFRLFRPKSRRFLPHFHVIFCLSDATLLGEPRYDNVPCVGRSKAEGQVGNHNRIYIYIYIVIIIIIQRDGSGTVVPIRIRTDSEPVG